MSWIIDAVRPYLGDPLGSPSNGNYKYRCPFHKEGKERSPSFYLHGEEGVAFCHACNSGWSVVQILKEFGASRRVIDTVVAGLPTPKKKAPRRQLRESLREVPALTEGILGVFEWCPEALVEKGFDEGLLQSREVG